MKKTSAIAAFVCFILLSACSPSIDINSENTSPPSRSCETPDSTKVPDNSSDTLAVIFDGSFYVQLPNGDDDVSLEDLDNHILTGTQKEAILNIINSVVDGYNTGLLPQEPVAENVEWFTEALPFGVTLPQTVLWEDITLYFQGTGLCIYHWVAEIPLNNNYTMAILISMEGTAELGLHLFSTNATFLQGSRLDFLLNWQDILPEHSFDMDEVEDYALALTDHLVLRGVQHLPLQEPLSDREIFNFVITIWAYNANWEYGAEFCHPYADIVTIEEGGGFYARYSEKAVQAMVYEVFGVADWRYKEGVNDYMRLPNNETEYYFPLGMGFPTSPYSYSAPRIVANDGNAVVVQFHLADTVLWPSSHLDYGEFQMTFRLMEENGNIFLRFENCLPVA